MPRRHIPTALRTDFVLKETPRFVVGSAVNADNETPLKQVFLSEDEALEYVGSYGDFIYSLAEGTKALWKWEQGGWSELLVEVPELPEAPETRPLSSADKQLSEDQAEAWGKLLKWVADPSRPYFVLKGYAGTGKTFLLEKLKGVSDNVYFSAPTNKATGVLSKAVARAAKTTYSILGLRMEQVEDKLVLTPSRDTPYFPKGSILVIDEAGVVSTQLCEAIEAARVRNQIKILFVGDPAQLPPVGERTSPSWRMTEDPECRSMLRKVMRFDNQLLTLSVALRECIKNKDWVSPLESDHEETGVWKWKSRESFDRALLKRISREAVPDTKVVAWRNKTVNRYNLMIRDALGFTGDYCVGDSLLLAEPVQTAGTIIAHIDEEFLVKEVDESLVKVDNKQVEVWRLTVEGARRLVLDIAKDQADVDVILGEKAAIAQRSQGQGRKTAWADFWDTKHLFNRVRYGYALTAHRAQGSTYKDVWIDQMDILSNPNKREAFRCLYVAATRPTTNLYSF